jgi:gamma-glutamylcyclotransferase (GGCT)/AIG2-like uncharacterized protein YtfP
MADHVNHFFVYGTLMRGQANHARFCAGALTIEPAVTTGRLYHLPMGFPAMVEASDGQVFGEAMTFPDIEAVLSQTDILEGYDPRRPDSSMYRRVAVPVLIEPSGQRATAWAYVWNRPLPQGATMLPTGRWRDRRWI